MLTCLEKEVYLEIRKWKQKTVNNAVRFSAKISIATGRIMWLEILYKGPYRMTTQKDQDFRSLSPKTRIAVVVTTSFKHYHYFNVKYMRILWTSFLNNICICNIQTPTEGNLFFSMSSYFVKGSLPKLHAFPDNQIYTYFLRSNQTISGLLYNALLLNF